MELADNEDFYIDLGMLRDFLGIFTTDARFYYGKDPVNPKSVWFIQKAQTFFGKHRVFTKSIQKIRHYLETKTEQDSNTRALHHDGGGDYVLLPKCNLLSGDADLVINAQDIKKYIANIKQKPGSEPGLADRIPESTGRTISDDRTGTLPEVAPDGNGPVDSQK